jgi:limonene-1,2-epoxide hydrolase
MAIETATRRALLGSAPLGASLGVLMLGAFAEKAAAAPAKMTPPEQANIKVVNAFLDATKPKDIAKALEFMTPDCSYRMTETTPAAKGYDAITARLKDFVDNADKINFEIFATYALGPIVINHRLDTFTSKTHPLLFEGVGVFFLKNGKIAEWTDYTIRAALSNTWPKPKAP